MTLEDTLQDLAERRYAFRAYRTNVDEELRKLRAEKLGAEQASIEHIVVKAMAEGATLGQVKRAYGTKDHRTIANIVAARASEIEAVREAQVEQEEPKDDWFILGMGHVSVFLDDARATFTWSEVDGLLMFSTDEPLWDSDYTIRNEAVALLDGKTEADSNEAREIASAIRAREA